MSLDALAPDQRAVVQLVLQQDRSYDELAGLLGISSDAVRERAHRGLERLAPGDELTPDERGEIVDYLLGQQSVSGRGTTRSLLSSSPQAREWALTVAGELRQVANAPLPEVPEPEAGEAGEDAAPAETPVIGAGEGVAGPDREPDLPPESERPEPGAAAAGSDPPVRARPRPRREAGPDRSAGHPAAVRDPAAAPRSSRRGGALLIGVTALLLVAALVYLLSRGGDDPKSTRADSSTATPSASATPNASATPQFSPLGSLPLTAPGGGKAQGRMVVFAADDGTIAFTIQGTDVPRSRAGEAYAVWLTGGGAPHRLGFAPPVKADGKFGTSGPRQADARAFADWFGRAKAVVVARETSEQATSPGPVVLRAAIKDRTKPGG